MNVITSFLVLANCLQLTLGAPLGLLSMTPARNYDVPPPSPHGHHVHVGEPQPIPEPNSDTFICLVQEIDGNFRVLRSLSQADCENSNGDVLYESGVHLPLSDPTYEEYFTRMQWSGNLFTRKFVTAEGEKGSIGVWKTISPEWYDHKAFTLVLNNDDTLSILFENTTSIWDSPMGATCLTTGKHGNTCVRETDAPDTTTNPTHPETTAALGTTTFAPRPLVLMRAGTRVENGKPIVVSDPWTGDLICVIQQSNGTFVVSHGDNCDDVNASSVIFQTCVDRGGVDSSVYTRLQRDGNLVTRLDSREVLWSSRSNQGMSTSGDFVLVLTASNSLAIMDGDGNQVWISTQDTSCMPLNLRKRL